MKAKNWVQRLLDLLSHKSPDEPIGKRAEREAALYLQRRGYQLLKADVRSPFGQIDLVCRKGNTIVFVEVKARSQEEFGSPLEGLRPKQKERLFRSGEAFIAKHQLSHCEVRFDLIGISFNKKGQIVRIEHIPNAFN
ncbi:MAG: YraN family protein [Armatimonadetes bacterium]|nr:YraN family protein [Armatimonadota bacterium]MDW8121994.1 YraN family protein [Armatimonadota bacterium]